MKVVIYGCNLYVVYSQISCLKQRTFVVFLAQARPLWKKNLFNNDSISDLWRQLPFKVATIMAPTWWKSKREANENVYLKKKNSMIAKY